MTRPWQEGIEIGVETAAALVRDQFAGIAAHDVAVLGSGWDNVALLIDRELVFRFPKKPSAATLIETEAQVLPYLASRLPLRVPEPEWLGRPAAGYPFPFIGYRVVPGQLGCRARLSTAERVRAAPVLGEFLARLHAIPAEDLELPGDVTDRRNFVARLPLMVERLDVLRAHGLIESADPWLALFRDLEHAPRTRREAIVHGDLYARHLLVDDRRALTGVIDWGDVHLGDPAMDLMLVLGFLPRSARAAFAAEYGQIGEDALRVARLRAAFHAVSVTWYGIEIDDRDLAREGRLALDFVLDD